MDFRVEVDQEFKELLRDFLKEFRFFNSQLHDFKVMAADYFGFIVKEDKE